MMTTSTPSPTDFSTSAKAVLSYLGLPEDYAPSPAHAPVEFLTKNLPYLPPHLLSLFSPVVTPKQRTEIAAIRNRRLKYTESQPAELSLSAAKTTWPTLWPGKFTPELARATVKDEKDWANKEFLGGAGKQVGKLGDLLGGYEEERETARARDLLRKQREWEESLPEEDEDTDDEDYADEGAEELTTREADAEADALFLRQIREKFIFGLLDFIDYDKVDWDEKWEPQLDRDGEERWFDDEEEGDAFDETGQLSAENFIPRRRSWSQT